MTQNSRSERHRRARLVRRFKRRLAALPGVVAVTSAKAPDDNSFRTAALAVDQGTSTAQHGQMILHYKYIQANYFQTLGIPLSAGRSFQEHGSSSERSVILSESAAKQLWPGENPVGRSLRLGPVDEKPHNERDLSVDGPAYLVIGIARDTRGVEFDGSDSRQVRRVSPVAGTTKAVESRKGAEPGPTGSRWFPFPAHQ